MMSKRKICVVITARPSYSRVKTALQAICDHPALELQLVVSGSALLDRYGSAVDVITEDGFKIAKRVYNVLEGESPMAMAKTTGLAVIELSTTFQDLSPDIVVTIADRYETIATSIAATYQNIPLAHIQGGEISGNIDEKVRHANTKLADIHLCATTRAMQRLKSMGENPSSIYVTGCPSIDLVMNIKNEVPQPVGKILANYNVSGNFEPGESGYFVVLQHPETVDFKSARMQVENILSVVSDANIPTLWFWPNVDAGSDGTSKGIRTFRERNPETKIVFLKNVKPLDFLRIIKMSSCLIGNSSAGIREAGYFEIPVLNIGRRQINRDRGKNVIDCGYEKKDLMEALNLAFSSSFDASTEYGSGDAGEKIAEALAVCELSFEKQLMF